MRMQILSLFSKNFSLLYHFAVRELKIRYKSPVLGFLWMFLLPLSMVFIFKIIFQQIIKIPVSGCPFFIFLTLGIFPWNYFGMSISGTVNSLVDSEALLKKVYFKRAIIPLSIILGNLINFLISNIIIIILMIFFKIPISKFIVFLPFLILLQTLFLTGISLLFAATQVYYRDIKYLCEIILLFWFYISPVFYPLRLAADVSERFFNFYLLNPMAHIITLYRVVYLKDYSAFLPKGVSLFYLLVYPFVSTLLLLIIGFYVFLKLEKRFTDFI